MNRIRPVMLVVGAAAFAFGGCEERGLDTSCATSSDCDGGLRCDIYAVDDATCQEAVSDPCELRTHNCDTYATCTFAAEEEAFACRCVDGFSGDGFSCVDVDECETATHACRANSLCSNELGTYACICNARRTYRCLTPTTVIIERDSGTPPEGVPVTSGFPVSWGGYLDGAGVDLMVDRSGSAWVAGIAPGPGARTTEAWSGDELRLWKFGPDGQSAPGFPFVRTDRGVRLSGIVRAPGDGAWVITNRSRVGPVLWSFDGAGSLTSDPPSAFSDTASGFGGFGGAAVDGRGRAWVTGWVRAPGASGPHEAWLWRFDADGTPSASFPTSTLVVGWLPKMRGLTVDAQGRPWATGVQARAGFGMTVWRHETSGVIARGFPKLHGHGRSGWATTEGWGIVSADDGHVWVVGRNAVGRDAGMTIWRLDENGDLPAGTPTYVRGATLGDDLWGADAVAADHGGIWVVGTWGDIWQGDLVVWRIDVSGAIGDEFPWLLARQEDRRGFDPYGARIARGDSGELWVLGVSTTTEIDEEPRSWLWRLEPD